ncbi:MAG TPA: hypothetical protein DD670_07375, partial [Planctomycetaceae bacterium]|nr:hypothetical protein [Planctomycetaceae bacterium]
MWRFDEGSGTDVSDSSGNGLNGVLVKQDDFAEYPDWIAGRTGQPGDNALRFGVGGTRNMVAAPYQPVMDSPAGNNAVTMAAWLSSEEIIESGETNWGRVFQRLNYLLYMDNVSSIDSVSTSINMGLPRVPQEVDVYDLTSTAVPVSTNSATNPAWNHVALTFDGTDIRFYINGVQKHVQNAPGTIKGDWWTDVQIGNSNRPTLPQVFNRQFVGALDDVAYFDSALTPAEISQVMSGDFSGFNAPRPVEGAHAYEAAVAALQPTHHYRFGTTGVIAPDSGFGATLIDGVLQTGEGGANLNSLGPGTSDGLPGFDASPANGAMGPRNVGALYLGDGTNWAAEQMTFSGWLGLASGTGTVVWDRVFTNSQYSNNLQMVIHDDGATAGEPAGLYITIDDPIVGIDAMFLPKSVVNLVDEEWHHLFVVRDGGDFGNMKVVIDGQDYTSQLTASPVSGFIAGNEWGTAMLGGVDAYASSLSGLMDEVSIWVGTALTVQDGIDLYNAALTNATYIPGDANRDGNVDAADAKTLATNWGETNASWAMGDFNKDGIIGPADAAILAANWG